MVPFISQKKSWMKIWILLKQKLNIMVPHIYFGSLLKLHLYDLPNKTSSFSTGKLLVNPKPTVKKHKGSIVYLPPILSFRISGAEQELAKHF